MDQEKRLKVAAVCFAVFWIAGMAWWSGEYHPAYIILLAVCGSLGGYLWYLMMHWAFRHMRLLPMGGHQSNGHDVP